MKIRTVDKLWELIAEDLAWRRQEIVAFDGQIARSRGVVRSALLRASAALLYAHWEGFVKQTLCFYANHLRTQRLLQADVRQEIVAFGFRSMFRRLHAAKRITDYVQFVEAFRVAEGSRLRIPGERQEIDTQSNLSSRVLEDLLGTFGLCFGAYRSKADLIDLNLLTLRNGIAHGEAVELALPEWEELRDGVTNLMDMIATDVIGHASNKEYLIAAA